jgi:DNA adenine methylase
MSKLKTPLRYPGGKSRAMKNLGQYIPRDIKYFHEPFLGGGSIALWVTQNIPDASIWVNDLYDNLFYFWTELRDNHNSLIDKLVRIKDDIKDDPEKGKEKFYEIKESIKNESIDVRAAYFFALNKMSFSGLGESSGFSAMALKSNFSYNSIEVLPQYSTLIQNWKITCTDYTRLFTDDPDTLIILDPPYQIESFLYGKGGNHHRGFDHDKFANECSKAKAKQLITYNSSVDIKNRFVGWNQIEWDLTYTMRSDEKYTKAQKKRKELILKNY